MLRKPMRRGKLLNRRKKGIISQTTKIDRLMGGNGEKERRTVWVSCSAGLPERWKKLRDAMRRKDFGGRKASCVLDTSGLSGTEGWLTGKAV